MCRGKKCYACNSVEKSGHYNIFSVSVASGMELLRSVFPDAKANEMNFVLFSTSGIHGSYRTIEETRTGDDVTFLVVSPRLVRMHYGNATISNRDDRAYLKKLRASSLRAVAAIGMPAK